MGVMWLYTIIIHFKSSILKVFTRVVPKFRHSAGHQKKKSEPSGDTKFQQWSGAKIKDKPRDGKHGKDGSEKAASPAHRDALLLAQRCRVCQQA